MNRHDARDVPEVLKRRIYEVVRLVPRGAVATYGDIAAIVGGCDARTVGFALNAIPKQGDEAIPWQRIINAHGGISTSGVLQRKLLQDEGVAFGDDGRIPLARFRWPGPTAEWAAEHGYQTLPPRDDGDQLSLFLSPHVPPSAGSVAEEDERDGRAAGSTETVARARGTGQNLSRGRQRVILTGVEITDDDLA